MVMVYILYPLRALTGRDYLVDQPARLPAKHTKDKPHQCQCVLTGLARA